MYAPRGKMSLIAALRLFWRARRKRVGPYLFSEAQRKSAGIEACCDSVECLVLGSSHGAQGFDPRHYPLRAFNLASTSQDLYTMNRLWRLYRDRLPRLKELIVFYSVFMPGFEIDKGKKGDLCAVLTHFYGIAYPNQRVEKYRRALNHRFRKCGGKAAPVSADFDGYLPVSSPGRLSAAERVAPHLRENKRRPDQTYLLEEVLADCRRRGIRVRIVIPPARSDYNDLIAEPDSCLFAGLLRLKKRMPFDLRNLRTSPDFTADDFLDTDHLNPAGAVRLTRILADQNTALIRTPPMMS